MDFVCSLFILFVSLLSCITIPIMSFVSCAVTDWAQPMVLRGHQGRVNCLLYPHGESPHYDMAHLVSGGIDFSINVWDMYTGNLVHRFVVQAGQVLQLLVPPPTCTVSCSWIQFNSHIVLDLKIFSLLLGSLPCYLFLWMFSDRLASSTASVVFLRITAWHC